ncbi:sulfatase-like hydrolase/transferase [Sulfurimonas sp. SAG-AH-194-C20]|nr:alkaline phosphatase family protein [Sulfurimonas sp. SAG-AH-194-C20]MDF1879529.1 sulfatase-like hydrolase/transferase [Sulfurimonas sp. SAG-AH-194-C20]
MQNSIFFLLKQFFLFFLFIEVFRTIFVIYYWDKLQVVASPITETLWAYVHAISLDVATASILLVIPWLLTSINILFKLSFIKIVLFIYTLGVFALSTFIYIAELGIYNEWEEKPTFKIFNYLKHPDEAIASNPLVLTVILTIILVSVLVLFYRLTKKLYATYDVKAKGDYRLVLFTLFLLPIIIFLGARGGWAEIPISQSTVYFSKHKVYNDLAISTVYNFIHSITENQAIINGKNPYEIEIDDKHREKILTQLMATPKGCERESLFTISRPNIILVIWESLSGDFIKNDKYKKVIPNIMKMSKEGILFTQIYASATLSHEGLPSIFSGWPALGGTYITNLPSKFYKLPFLTQKLKENNYTTSFIFGGQLRYGNLTSYMYGNGFDIIEEHSDIELDSSKEGVLGFHDGYMFEYLQEKSSKLKEPFFSAIFTVSSHSPYDQPMEDTIEWGDGDKGYLNSVYYTDKSIDEFIKSAKKESWYKNTLFIFVADHSHHTPLAWSRADKRWHHIPMLFYGDVIKKEYRGKSVDKIVAQGDIPATLLSQLGISHSKFIWSRDVFCKEYKENAYIMNKNGFGLITKEGSLTYDLKENRVIYKDGNISGLQTKGNVYMQKLLQTYLDY